MSDNAEYEEDFKQAKLIGKIIWCIVRDDFFDGDVFTQNKEDPLKDFDYKSYLIFHSSHTFYDGVINERIISRKAEIDFSLVN